MRYVRPFQIDELSKGPAQEWLLGPDEGAGCAVRLHRGGVPANVTVREGIERFALVLAGAARLHFDGEVKPVERGELAFIPAGVAGDVSGDADAVWAEIEAPLPAGVASAAEPKRPALAISVDQSRFEGGGFAYQSLVDAKQGAQTMRMNVLQVQPGSGSPDYHIHAFAQIYLIQEGTMTLDIGKARTQASGHALVVLPAGVVHRNFNASNALERHVSLLVPEPKEGEVFDFAVTIHNEEALVLERVPA